MDSYNVGNENALQHGGERAVKALSAGTSLVGMAHQLQLEVHDEIERDGLLAVMRVEAERYLAVARLFFGLVLGAESLDDVDRFARRFGWLSSKAWNMLERLRELEGDPNAIDYEDIVKELDL